MLDKAWPEVFARLEMLGVEPAGARFIRYDVIDMEGLMEIEVGVPVAAPIPGDGNVEAGTMPAGRYATLTHIGHYDHLMAANAALQDWAEERGLKWDMRETAEGERWGSRLELYETDPDDEPNPDNWRTEVTYRLADG